MTNDKKYLTWKKLSPWLDVVTILAWGVLMFKYWLTGQLNILIHRNYFWLTVVAGIALLCIGCFQAWLLYQQGKNSSIANNSNAAGTVEHISLFGPGWSTGLLLMAAVVGLLGEPKVFASDKAIQRGVSDFLPVTQTPQTFRYNTRPEERSLIGWVRTLTVYPEPDAYTGQKVKVSGFVIHLQELPEQYLLLSRFVITCCAADAYPVGLPVKLEGSRSSFPPDTWLEVEGQMITETLQNKRQLTIQASSVRKIPQPANPYDS
ncbi:TIGR03943 family putative permease subunit [[Phormidium] sp. ETS-05]|uniref:TIGR03943 family putative permease subunit n=1 Tax=[Phormidium] sp. ETS-05 TaxID=222819 RepID=UPI0018EEDA5B|nr:TIGR03943 family protein [[Phormidium] sp. ETS-05]